MSDSTRSPIKDNPLRLPGQSVAEERENLIEDTVIQPMTLALLMAIIAGLEWWRYFIDMKPSPVIFSMGAGIAICYAVIRFRRSQVKRRNLRQALTGERVVGQFLERLREGGYQVFHDIVGDGFNVDHVLIGPAGVFTVETKTWSKPTRGNAQVTFDGEAIRTGTITPERDPVVQSKAQASWLKSVLRESTGKTFAVRSVIVFPGWFVKNEKGTFKDIWVLEPKALPTFLQNEERCLPLEDIKLASFHLSRFIRSTQKSF